jgi:hypothetical protein
MYCFVLVVLKRSFASEKHKIEIKPQEDDRPDKRDDRD